MRIACHCVQRLKNPIQYYAWGSRHAIADLVGREVPSSRPEAELWMGTHPKAPSHVIFNGGTVPLGDLIMQCPEDILGPEVVHRFGPNLPFLFKVLAADQPLSIQAHPNREQALKGYALENQAGLPLDAPNRNYRDENHKPEIICALTDFWGLNGFRPMDDLQRQIDGYCPSALGDFLAALQGRPPEEVLKHFFNHIMSLEGQAKTRVIDEVLNRASGGDSDASISRWVMKLAEAYPGDIGILAPIFLNLILLHPGEALYLPAGQLHAYLEGVGVELMANSDNVLRGGLTPKHIDREELMRVLRFAPQPPQILHAQTVSPSEACFHTPAEEFALVRIRVSQDVVHAAPHRHNVAILLLTAGQLVLAASHTGDKMKLVRGDCVLIPAAAGAYRLSGEAEAFLATVP